MTAAPSLGTVARELRRSAAHLRASPLRASGSNPPRSRTLRVLLPLRVADHPRRVRQRHPPAPDPLRSVIIRILIIAIVALFLVMWVRAVIDVWRRTDLSSSA